MDNDKLVQLNHEILDKNEEILRKLYEKGEQLAEANKVLVDLQNNGYYPTIIRYLKKYKLWRKP